jgi:hypothetical protein
MNMAGSFTYDERVRNYDRILRYWLSVIDTIDLDLAIFSDPPHHVGQYMLYAVCVENDIQTLIFTSAPVPGFVFPRAQIHSVPDNLRDTYNQYMERDEAATISATSEEYIDEIINVDAGGGNPNKNGIFPIIKKILGKLFRIRQYPAYCRTLVSEKVTHRKPSNQLPENATVLGYKDIIYKLKSDMAQRKLQKHYDHLSQKPVYDRDYIYFPLHLQPERATNPDGGVYSDQYLVADLLSKHIPNNWSIYIKEHPLQFSSSNLGEQGRSTYDYDDFNNLDNTNLIDITASQRELIDNASAVATVTGTAGWEAVNRGVPAIVFGNASYQLCEGVYHVKNNSELQSAITSIQNGEQINPADIRRFVQAIETVGYRVPMYERENVCPDTSTAVDRYATCIVEFVENSLESS